MPAAAAPDRVPGRLEQLCWDRHARDLALAYPDGPPKTRAQWRRTQHPKGLWFDPEAAERPTEFLETFCRHHKGEWAGRPLLLEEWQKRALAIAFGWMRPDGTRRFRIIYFEVPRKNGKTEIAAGLGVYLLVADDEPGAEVYSAATKKDQAKIAHDAAKAMVKASPELRRLVKPFRNNLNVPRTGSKFEPLGADSNTLDGLNPHAALIDELHAHKDRGVFDVLDTAMGARRQPVMLLITTAGIYDPESIGWLQHEHALKVLEGALEDDAFFAFVACADASDDWTKPAAWATANPNFGISVKESYLAQQALKAEQQPSFLNTFLRLHLNIWTQQRDRWIPIERWNACDVDRDPAWHRRRAEQLRGRPCHGGLDLSTKLDITALALLFPLEDDISELLLRFWVPEETMQRRSKQDRVPYDAWHRDGWLVATPGDVVDYDFIREDIRQLGAVYPIQELAYDPWNATQIATQLLGDGFQMVEVRQGFRSLSEPCKEFEKLVTARRIRHGGHPVMRWMVSNASLRRDPNDNIAPDKASSSDRIDGVVAGVMALSRQIVNPARHSVYEQRGVQTF